MSKRRREKEPEIKLSALKLYTQAMDQSERMQDELALQSLEASMRLYESDILDRNGLLATLQINVGLLTNNTRLYRNALKNYKLHEQMEPTSWKAYQGLVVANYLLHKDEDSKEALFKIVQYSGDLEFVKEWALKLDCIEEVIELYESKLKPYKSGATNFLQEEYEYLVEIQKNIIELDDNNSLNYEWLAYFSFQAKKYDECFAALEQAINLKPDSFNLHFTYAYTSFKTNGDYAKTLKALKNAIELARHKDQIEKIISNFIVKEPTGRYLEIADYAYSILALIEKENKNYAAALEAAEKALACNPSSLSTLGMIGKIYRDLEDYDNSLVAYEKIIELSPDCIAAQLNKVVCLCMLGRIIDAYDELLMVRSHPAFVASSVYMEFIETIKVILYDKVVELEQFERGEIEESLGGCAQGAVSEIHIAVNTYTPQSTIVRSIIPGLSDDGSAESPVADLSSSPVDIRDLAGAELDQWLSEAALGRDALSDLVEF